MWLGSLLLIAVAVFIVWDGRRLRRAPVKALPREALRNGYTPRGLVAWHFWVGMGIVAAFLAFAEWRNPSKPPFTGRWSWLHQAAYAAFGAHGIFILFVALGAAATGYGLVLWRIARKGGGSAG